MVGNGGSEGNVGIGKPGTVGRFGGFVWRRWRAKLTSMLTNTKAANKAKMNELVEAMAK